MTHFKKSGFDGKFLRSPESFDVNNIKAHLDLFEIDGFARLTKPVCFIMAELQNLKKIWRSMKFVILYLFLLHSFF